MASLNDIEQKIQNLKQKKETLEKRILAQFVKRIQSHTKEPFDPEILLGFFIEHWQNPSATQKKKWQDKGALFFRGNPSTKTQKDNPTHEKT